MRPFINFLLCLHPGVSYSYQFPVPLLTIHLLIHSTRPHAFLDNLRPCFRPFSLYSPVSPPPYRLDPLFSMFVTLKFPLIFHMDSIESSHAALAFTFSRRSRQFPPFYKISFSFLTILPRRTIAPAEISSPKCISRNSQDWCIKRVCVFY